MKDSEGDVVARGTTPPIMIIDSRKQRGSAVTPPSEPPINGDGAPSQQPLLSSHEVSSPVHSPLFSPAPRRPTPVSHPEGSGFGSTTHDDDSHPQPSDPEPPEAVIGILGHELNSGTGPSPLSLQHTTNAMRLSSAVSTLVRDSVYELLNPHAQIAGLEPGVVTSDATVVSAPTDHPDLRATSSSLLQTVPPHPQFGVSPPPADDYDAQLQRGGEAVNFISDDLVPNPSVRTSPPSLPLLAPDADTNESYLPYIPFPPLNPAPPPQVSLPHIQRINPRSGPITGRTEVFLLGTNFPRETSVTFGEKRAHTEWFSETACVCISPPASIAGPVEVTFSGLPMGATQSFTYLDTRENDLYVLSPSPKSSIDAYSVLS